MRHFIWLLKRSKSILAAKQSGVHISLYFFEGPIFLEILKKPSLKRNTEGFCIEKVLNFDLHFNIEL